MNSADIPLTVVPARTSIWRDLRHAILGAALGLSVMWALAGAEEEVQIVRPPDEIEQLVLDIGHSLCAKHSSRAAAATNLTDGYVRFRCRSGVSIEEKLILE